MTAITDDDLRTLAEALGKELIERRLPRPSWNRRIDLLIGLLALVALIFSAGVNWSQIGYLDRRIAILEQRQDRQDQTILVQTNLITEQRLGVAVLVQKLDTLQADMTVVKQQFVKAFR